MSDLAFTHRWEPREGSASDKNPADIPRTADADIDGAERHRDRNARRESLPWSGSMDPMGEAAADAQRGDSGGISCIARSSIGPTSATACMSPIVDAASWYCVSSRTRVSGSTAAPGSRRSI